MLQVVLLVLKIIGIILASVLGLLIALILIVLFVPIRYKVKAECQEQLKAAARVSWLLRIISFSAEYNTKDFALTDNLINTEEAEINLRMRLRIFGRIIFDSNRKKEDIPEKASKDKKLRFSFKRRSPSNEEKVPAQDEKGNDEHSLKKPEPALMADNEPRDIRDKAARAELTRISRAKAEAVTGSIEKEEKDHSSETTPFSVHNPMDQAVAEETQGQKADTNEFIPHEIQESEKERNKIDLKDSEQIGIKQKDIKQIDSKQEGIQKTVLKENQKSIEDSQEQIKEKGIFNAFRRFLHGLKNITIKIKNFITGIKLKAESIIATLRKLYDKYSLVKLFFQDENNKLGLKYGYDNLKGILRHIKPRKVIANIEFGTGDPSSTGQILGVAAVFMGIYGNSVKIIPDFENEVIKGDFYCRGRIHSFVLLIIGIKVIRNRNIKTLIKNFQTLKEEI
ncbi:DUF2953 domain-containing protein [Anaerocolumna sp. AGMB13020]|uniref:DUF2953 domain-containing protein n=1 Tax=Anaerocolumna sp. AGMB13020 TaxID=3081750 RepID=UPI002953494D|nr:DUF2953 domain-containing protein [Anaerocolumna sp. AGMB13020]WOO36357.1 DUF2953 domain-containing protein [Anaerocolumna sp. AGMB13020]